MKIINRKKSIVDQYLIKRLVKKVIRKCYKPSLILIVVQVVSLPFIVHYNRATIKYALGIESKYLIQESIKNNISNLIDYNLYLKDILSSIFTSRRMEKVDLKINLKNISSLRCNPEESHLCIRKNWANAVLSYKGKDIRIKLRRKGLRKLHDLGLKKMSFRVDVKGDETFEGLDDFSIQMPVIRGYDNELLIARMMENNGLLTPKHMYIKMYINGEYVGIRHVEEIISKELIERKNKRYGALLKLNKNYSDKFNYSRFKAQDKKHWETKNTKLLNESLTILESIKKDNSLFSKYFDEVKWGRYIGLLDGFQSFHGTLPKSVGFHLNPITGKFEPVLFDAHYERWHVNTRLSELATRNKNETQCNEALRGAQHAVNLCNNLRWYKILFGKPESLNSDFYISYFNTLEKIGSENFINNEFEKIWVNYSLERGSIYREFWRADEFFQFGLMPYIAPLSKIKARLRTIGNEVNIAKSQSPLISIDLDDKSIVSFTNQTSRLPQIIYLRCNKVESKPLILVKDLRRSFNLSSLGDCNIDNTYYTADNYKSLKKINKLESTSLGFDQLINTEYNLKTDKSYSKIYKKGLHEINEDSEMVSENVFFEPGAVICIKDNVNLSFRNSNLTFSKQSSNLGVQIIGCNSKGGSLIIQGSNMDINDLSVKNLSSPSKNALGLYAGINIIDSHVKFKKMLVEDSASEDAINVINSQIEGDIMIFNNVRSDAFDSDNSILAIKRINCKYVGNDCIDVSNSIGKVNTIYSMNVKDKALSIGENSLLEIKDIDVRESELGLVVKDQSKIYINSYTFEKVKIPIAAYIKKKIYGPPAIFLENGNLRSYKSSLISKDSNVYINGSKFKSKLKSKYIVNILYGTQFGVKTKR